MLTHSEFPVAREELPPFAGTHMVRDLRDVVVSGYFFHLWTNESWVHVPDERYGGRSYQQHLQAVDRDEGLLREIEHLAGSRDLRVLRAWNYRDPRVLELKYEDVISDERTWFEVVFRHYGFHERAVERSVGLALEQGFERAAGRRVGEVKEGRHMRSGRPGEWMEFFNAAHREAFKRSMGQLLVDAGYETSLDW